MYYAHSTNDVSRSNWQLLADHLDRVADEAARFGARFGVEAATRLAGLLHDLGKYTRAFQARLEGSKESVDHSTAGAALVMRLAKAGKLDDGMIAELVAYAIAGHHAGLPDKQGESYSTLCDRLKAFSEEVLDPAWETEVSPDVAGLMPAHFHWASMNSAGSALAKNAAGARLAFQLAFLGRMIFSCLVDADYLDTERFYAETEGLRIDRDWPTLRTELPRLIEAFEGHMAGLGTAETPVNRLRKEILEHVRRRAGEARGLYTLTVPTGGGKTLASLGFALDHARAHGNERIIYAIPFTSIIDQTAETFRKVLGNDLVLEHHSAIEEEFDPKRRPEGKDKLKLAMENWAAPVVVTTTVQLFESLFAARTSRCRKLHNIAGSIIILDEAQTLPRPLLAPAVSALRELAENYGCTIVLCTATQPALDARNFAEGHPAGLPLEGKELAPDPAELARKLTRVRLHHAGNMDDEALVGALAEEPQALVIVNSRGHALALYRAAKEAGLDGLFHLTTRQYAAHRREILATVRQRLKDEEPCRVIATSLVEAGVDVDFPKVWRAEAGLDQVAQAAGRCNREGGRPIETSIVTIFSAPDNPSPKEIKDLTGDMSRIVGKHGDDLLSPAAIEDFFREVYWRIGPEGMDRGRKDGQSMLARFTLNGRETNFAFRTVAENFRMIDSGMVPVIIPRDDQARAAVRELGIEDIPSGVIARKLQTYIVQIPPKARARLMACGHVSFAEEEKRRDQFAVLMTGSLYKPEVGLIWEDAEYLGLEQSVI